MRVGSRSTTMEQLSLITSLLTSGVGVLPQCTFSLPAVQYSPRNSIRSSPYPHPLPHPLGFLVNNAWVT